MGYFYKVNHQKWWDESSITEYISGKRLLHTESGYDKRGHQERTDVYKDSNTSVIVVKTKFGIMTSKGFENLCVVKHYNKIPKKYTMA